MSNNAATRNGHEWRDTVHRLLSRWMRCGTIEKEKSNIFTQIGGTEARADIFIPCGLLESPFDLGVVIEAKTQDGIGSAHERAWKDYMNALVRSPYATLFACEGKYFEYFVEWVNGYESQTIARVFGRHAIIATQGTKGLVSWFEQYRKKNVLGVNGYHIDCHGWQLHRKQVAVEWILRRPHGGRVTACWCSIGSQVRA